MKISVSSFSFLIQDFSTFVIMTSGVPPVPSSAAPSLFGGKSKLMAVIGDEVRFDWRRISLIDFISLRTQWPDFYSEESENWMRKLVNRIFSLLIKVGRISLLMIISEHFFNRWLDTKASDIEETFKNFLLRDDIGIILISQNVSSIDEFLLLNCDREEFQIAEIIRGTVDAHDKSVPAILEIPSKEHPYDPSKDSILRRARVSKQIDSSRKIHRWFFRECSVWMILNNRTKDFLHIRCISIVLYSIIDFFFRSIMKPLHRFPLFHIFNLIPSVMISINSTILLLLLIQSENRKSFSWF